MLPDDVDPQLHLSVNDRAQPFYLICEKDCVLVQMSGSGVVSFRGSAVTSFPSVTGDFIYVPARTPHRIVPTERSIQYRYKAQNPGYEAVCWYCEHCGERIGIQAWDAAVELPQEGYLRACETFNADEERRRCGCGQVHPPIDLTPYRWAEVAAQLRSKAAASDEW